MTWDEIQERIREEIKTQPRGFQKRLSEDLGITRAAVGQWVTGKDIPRDKMDEVLKYFNLELTLQPRK